MKKEIDIIMKNVKCPCCGYYTHTEDCYLFEICKVCFWQYDLTSHDTPNVKSGANKISLNEARENYKKYGVSELEYINNVRKPLPEELPENNLDGIDEPNINI